jgi:hypothetical protein
MDIPPFSWSSEVLFPTPISDEDVCKAIKRLKSSKSLRLDDIRGFI